MEFIKDSAQNKFKRLLIVGAGRCGRMLIGELRKKLNINYEPIVFVDDDPSLLNTSIDGIKIAGTTKDIPCIAKEYNIDIILIAIPSLTGDQLRRVIDICIKTQIPTKIFPAIFDILNYFDNEKETDKAKRRRLNIIAGHPRDINYEDFIKRQPPLLEIEKIKEHIGESVVLVTGAGGSIGKSIVQELLHINPKKLILIDNNEQSIFTLTQSIKKESVNIILGDIRDVTNMERIFQEYKPDIIIHAAAYKHVHIVEKNVREGILTNVIGTYNLVNLAIKYSVRRFIFISTDKAVDPIGIMGATKRICELIIQNLPKTQTSFSIVRFGNVIGSSGSLFTIWEEQIKQGVLDITHPKMTRYFMLTQEAAMLILQTIVMEDDHSGVFIFDMGNLFKITDLAEQFVETRGYKLGKDVRFNFIGIRPGEKLREALFHEGEKLIPTTNSRIFFVEQKNGLEKEGLTQKIMMLKEKAMTGSEVEILQAMGTILPNFLTKNTEQRSIERSPKEIKSCGKYTLLNNHESTKNDPDN